MCTCVTLERAGYVETKPSSSSKFCTHSLTCKSILSIIAIITGVGLIIGYYASGPGASKWLLNIGGAAIGGPIGAFIANLICLPKSYEPLPPTMTMSPPMHFPPPPQEHVPLASMVTAH